ncbi:MAG: biotin--[acetyl-CoA-carboxylase] ligase [Myxococcota bacterium]
MELLAETGSTNDDALALAEAGVEPGHVVVADTQRRGRGSHGRHWSSPPGVDLYFSIVLPRQQARHGLLTLGAGLAVALALEALDLEVAIKWPNDIWINGQKAAGILAESRSMGAEVLALVLGIGINVNRETFTADDGAATSLRAMGGRPYDRTKLLAEVLANLENVFSLADALVIREVDGRLALRHAVVRLETETESVQGRLLGIDASGAVRLDVDGVETRCRSGRLSAPSGPQRGRSGGGGAGG